MATDAKLLKGFALDGHTVVMWARLVFRGYEVESEYDVSTKSVLFHYKGKTVVVPERLFQEAKSYEEIGAIVIAKLTEIDDQCVVVGGEKTDGSGKLRVVRIGD